MVLGAAIRCCNVGPSSPAFALDRNMPRSDVFVLVSTRRVDAAVLHENALRTLATAPATPTVGRSGARSGSARGPSNLALAQRAELDCGRRSALMTTLSRTERHLVAGSCNRDCIRRASGPGIRNTWSALGNSLPLLYEDSESECWNNTLVQLAHGDLVKAESRRGVDTSISRTEGLKHEIQ